MGWSQYFVAVDNRGVAVSLTGWNGARSTVWVKHAFGAHKEASAITLLRIHRHDSAFCMHLYAPVRTILYTVRLAVITHIAAMSLVVINTMAMGHPVAIEMAV